MVGAVAGEDLVRVGVEARECVGPDVRRRLHQPLVRLVVELLEGAAQDMHPVAAVETRQAREREVPRRGEMVDRGAAGWEVELLWVEVDTWRRFSAGSSLRAANHVACWPELQRSQTSRSAW